MKMLHGVLIEDRSLRGVTDPDQALKDSFTEQPVDTDLELLMDQYYTGYVSEEGEKWDSFKRGLVKVGEGASKFFKGVAKVSSKVYNGAKFVTGKLVNFTSNLIESIKDKVVTENYVNKKFATLKEKLSTSENMRNYVSKVPSYETMIKRITAIEACASYIKDLANSEDVHDSQTIMEQLAVKSKGVVKAVASKGSSFANLVWVEAELEEYDLKGSKLGTEQGIATLKNAFLHCKFNATDDLAAAAKIIDKRAREAAERDAEDAASDYAITYTVGKVINQFFKEGIQKELNTIGVTYLSRLSKFVDK